MGVEIRLQPAAGLCADRSHEATAVEAWRRVLGHVNVDAASEHDLVDIGRHRTRSVVAVLRPQTVDDVRQAIRVARESGVPIHPISTGRNWGMGSRTPAVDGCALLDLGALRKIRTLDLEHGYAVVEPGVSQRQLADALEGSSWLLNVTAGCADASVVGNALERGDGTIRSRVRDLVGLEAVLADGALVTTGGLDASGRYRGPVAGADLTQTFVQSPLAVVTAAALALIPRPECICLVHARIERGALGRTVELLGGLLRSGLPGAGLLRIRELWITPEHGTCALPTGADRDRFVVTGPLLGTNETVELGERILREALSELGSVRSLDALTASPEDPLHARASHCRGRPTCSALQDTLGVSSCDQVDGGATGFLALLPLVPLDRHSVLDSVDLLQSAVTAHSTALSAEWNLVSPHIANGVVQIGFDARSPGATARAHAVRDEARRLLISAGMPPYRSNIDHASDEMDARADSAHALRAIKAALDEDRIIAPGHYFPEGSDT